VTVDQIDPRWRLLFTADTLAVMLKTHSEDTNARLEMLAVRARDALDVLLPELRYVLTSREPHALQRSASILGAHWQCFTDAPSVCGELHDLASRSQRAPCPPLPREVEPLIAAALRQFEPIRLALDRTLGARSRNGK
jgi:hypothetical protein